MTAELTLTSRNTTASYAPFQGSIGSAAVGYKPIAGEQPLWDFPDGRLAHRGVAPISSRRCRAGTSCRAPGNGTDSSAKAWVSADRRPTRSRTWCRPTKMQKYTFRRIAGYYPGKNSRSRRRASATPRRRLSSGSHQNLHVLTWVAPSKSVLDGKRRRLGPD